MARLKSWVAALLAFLAAFFAAVFYREKANHEEEKREAIERVRHSEQEANKALVEGLTQEQEAIDAAKGNPRRDHFERR